jgi:hypothetical protein
MRKFDAAKFLDISEKTLERLVKNGEISSRLEKGKTRDVVIFDEAELKLFKERRESAKHRPAFSPVQNSISLIATKADSIDRQTQTLEFLEVLRSAVTSQKPIVPIADKILLTVNECRALSGLSEKRIIEAIKTGKLKGQFIGKGWKIKRGDLNEYVGNL